MKKLIKRITDHIRRKPLLVKPDVMCSLFEHQWLYNENRQLRICKRCKIKEVMMECYWAEIEKLVSTDASNEELIASWKP